MSIADIRQSYDKHTLLEKDAKKSPYEQFELWFNQALSDNVPEPTAMTLATADAQGRPSARIVLLKGYDTDGFVFYTNYESRKAHGIEINPNVSLLFPWYAMERQVSISGVAEKVSAQESDDYFATRPWGSQIGAWASAQSSHLASREELEQRFEGAALKWPEGTVVPRPPHWGGYRVTPLNIEFWQGRYSRLHDRLRYERTTTSGDWELSRYYP